MQDTEKKKLGNEDSKKKERHIVTWTQQEDDILREQISSHGTENWAIIASKFKDKTTRQCRRRWYTYLNSDFKKGGWSPEEDMLLCEAQKIFGNRWTEIAKVVSGRTDNAVKNRFSTLCKKKAKYEALAKENATSYINSNNKRVLDGSSKVTTPIKKMRRRHEEDITVNCNVGDGSSKSCGMMDQQLRAPFAVLIQNLHNIPAENRDGSKNNLNNDESNKIQGTFLRKDDPKLTALMQQAELLSSLAQKVNTENTDQSLEKAWKELQDFLTQSKENDTFGYGGPDVDFQLEDIKDLIEDLRSNDGCNWRQHDLHESPESSEYSTGSTLLTHTAGDRTEQTQPETGGLRSGNIREDGCEDTKQVGSQCWNEGTTNNVAVSVSSSTEYSSPMQVTPLFRSLAAGIPSPKFSESERNFLLKTLGVESPSPNPSQAPPCKRSLLQSL